MSWLDPAAAGWLVLLPALLGLYMLRPRPRRQPVASLRFWRAVPVRERTRARLRRPPRSLLLVLQLALLAVGALALLRPALTAPAGHQQVILLDASGSMAATDGGAPRFEQARAAARQVVAALGPDDTATLLRVGPAVTTVCAGCRAPALLPLLDGLQAGAGRADMDSALRVAAGLAAQAAPGQIETVVISDGAFAPLPAAALPPALRWVAVGGKAPNRAITALAARRPPDGSSGYSVYARVENFGPAPLALDVAAYADTVPLPVRHITVPAPGRAELIWAVPAGTARVLLNLPAGDALAADDSAICLLPESAQERVAVQAGDPDRYTAVLAGLPGVTLAEPGSGADLTILEGALPAILPAGNLLLINPSGNLLPETGRLTAVQPLAAPPGHPLLAGLDLGGLFVRTARRYAAVSWLDPVLAAPGGPLLLAGARDGRRIAVLAFDLRDSNLPTLAAFPLLLANLVEWLDPLASAAALAPGAPLALAPGSTVLLPGGGQATVGADGLFADTETPGLYQILRPAGAARLFVVNLTDAAESDLAPRPHPELTRTVTAPPAPRLVRQEYWPALLAGALVLLAGEWVWFSWKRGLA